MEETQELGRLESITAEEDLKVHVPVAMVIAEQTTAATVRVVWNLTLKAGNFQGVIL